MQAKIDNRVLHLVFRSQNVMQETFCRAAVYYEGRGYFVGYNMDIDTLERYFSQNATLTKYERELKKVCFTHKGDCDYVVAYLQGDRDTMTHELRHARFHSDKRYSENVHKLWNGLTPSKRSQLVSKLQTLGYREDKWVDEAQAYGWLFTHRDEV